MSVLTEKIIELRKDNKTLAEISKITGANYYYIREVCRKNCPDIKYAKPRAEKKKSMPHELICERCGATFLNSRKSCRFCSDSCRNKSYNESRKQKSVAVHEKRFCVKCGELFVTTNNRQKFCSRKCGKAFRGLGRKYTSSRDERLQEAVKYDKAVNLHTLIKRDNNKCMICGCDCDLYDYEVTASGAIMCGYKYPTIDHIIPCSKGGEHTWNNVQLACLRCNREKSNVTI